jgi:hypothetical protein
MSSLPNLMASSHPKKQINFHHLIEDGGLQTRHMIITLRFIASQFIGNEWNAMKNVENAPEMAISANNVFLGRVETRQLPCCR